MHKRWKRLRGGCGGLWELTGTRYTVQHCGHPTALWPYTIHTPDGWMIVAPNGKGFRHLKDAQEEAERLADKRTYKDMLKKLVESIPERMAQQALILVKDLLSEKL
jgi:hypothetical protein